MAKNNQRIAVRESRSRRVIYHGSQEWNAMSNAQKKKSLVSKQQVINIV